MTVMDYIIILIFIAIIAVSEIQKYIYEKKQKNSNAETKIDSFCNKHYKKIWIFFAIILFITVIYKFGKFPDYIGVDEAGMAYDSYCLANYGVDRYMNSYPLYLINFGGGQSILCSYISTIFIKLLGANMITYRMPVLLIYLLGTIASYLFVSRAKDKKTALLFTFLIITCPWNIMNARQALDCNLYAGMLMINLFLMNRAKKNYQYILAGISVGITLYTYCLSWITMPIFLALWAIYMLYLKKVNIKQLITFAIPIIILAIPLVYFLLLNYGIVNRTQIGIFTFPILTEFRGGQISILNIWKTGWESIQTIFLSKNTIYAVYIPLFIIGYIVSFGRGIKEIKKKEHTLGTIMIIVFTSMLIGLLFTRIPTPNKANVLYIPILYFVTVAILEICKNSRILFVIAIIAISTLFINFEYKYYTQYAVVQNSYWYEDKSLTELSKVLEQNEQIKNLEKYVIVYRTAPYIYPTLGMQMSPYEFSNTFETKEYRGIIETTKVGKYHYYSYFYNVNELGYVNFKDNNYIVIVSKQFEEIVDYIEKQNYEKQEYKDLYVFTNKESEIQIDI